MAELIAIVGASGSGKSTSIRTLDPKTTFIINVASKPLPFKGWKSNYTNFNKENPEGKFKATSDVDTINQLLQYINTKRTEIKTIVIDDAQYIMSFEAMDRAREKGFDKFTEIAQKFYSILKKAISMRDDLHIVVSCHAENVGDVNTPYYKIKTVGKMIDNLITVEGLFTYVLFTDIERNDDNQVTYSFITRSDGTNTAKSPLDCFDSVKIPNDLQFVIDKIDEFNN